MSCFSSDHFVARNVISDFSVGRSARIPEHPEQRPSCPAPENNQSRCPIRKTDAHLDAPYRSVRNRAVSRLGVVASCPKDIQELP
jgi:hypothetical protein